jgi:hypothetical protein
VRKYRCGLLYIGHARFVHHQESAELALVVETCVNRQKWHFGSLMKRPTSPSESVAAFCAFPD